MTPTDSPEEPFFKELQLSSPELRDEMSRYAAALHTHSTRLWRFAVEILDPTDLATITELATQPALLDCIRRAQARLETLRAFIGYLDQQLPDFAVHYNDPTREDELLRVERRESNSPLTPGGFGAYRLTVVDDLLQQLPAAGVPVWCNDNRLISRLLGGRAYGDQKDEGR